MPKHAITSAIPVISGLLVLSCSHIPSEQETYPTVQNFGEVKENLGKPVRINAIYGDINEAHGLYLSDRDFRRFDEGGQCLLYSDQTLQHGERVELIGTISDSGCGTELICITICQPYKFEALAD